MLDEEHLMKVSGLLKNSKIVLGDYKTVLRKYAEKDDFVFLDPPYLPTSEYSDFKRYTKEQFYEEDHVELANSFTELKEKGCHVILTNSNHPFIHNLYKNFSIEVHKTRRNINSKSSKRYGEDVIVSVKPKKN